MTAQENGGDTLAEGALMRRIFAAPAGVRLLRIVSDTTSSFNYADRDHEEDIIVPSRGEVAVQNWEVPGRVGTECVSFVRVVGDTNGPDAGVRTGFEGFLNPVQVEFEAATPWPSFPVKIDQVAEGQGVETTNGCSGAAGAAL